MVTLRDRLMGKTATEVNEGDMEEFVKHHENTLEALHELTIKVIDRLLNRVRTRDLKRARRYRESYNESMDIYKACHGSHAMPAELRVGEATTVDQITKPKEQPIRGTILPLIWGEVEDLKRSVSPEEFERMYCGTWTPEPAPTRVPGKIVPTTIEIGFTDSDKE